MLTETAVTLEETLAAEQPSIRIQLFPHHDAHQFAAGFKFITIDKVCKPNTLLKIGRKVDKKDSGELSSYDTPSIPKIIDALSFKSKVVSRAHAELFISNDGQVSFRDVGSSSGSFLNRLRLSASGKKSPFQTLKSGDIIQLGVDYQSRQEEVYKAVMMKIFITVKSKDSLLPKKSPLKLKKALLSLLAAMNSTTASKTEHASCTECCICLCSLSPYQALFLAPCSHCFHYKCVVPLLQSLVLFQCPLCRQVANLCNTEFLDDEDDLDVFNEEEIDVDSDERKSLEGMDLDPGNDVGYDDALMMAREAIDSNATSSSSVSAPMAIPHQRPSIVIPEDGIVSVSDCLSPSTPKNDISLNQSRMDAQEREAREERVAVLRSKLIKLSIEFPGFLVQEEVDKLLATEFPL